MNEFKQNNSKMKSDVEEQSILRGRNTAKRKKPRPKNKFRKSAEELSAKDSRRKSLLLSDIQQMEKDDLENEDELLSLSRSRFPKASVKRSSKAGFPKRNGLKKKESEVTSGEFDEEDTFGKTKGVQKRTLKKKQFRELDVNESHGGMPRELFRLTEVFEDDLTASEFEIYGEPSKSVNGYSTLSEKNWTRLDHQYYKNYLKKNTLDVLFEAFTMLDSTINMFFFAYEELLRSSYLAGRVWICVMKIRIMMNDSINHVVEAPQHLSPQYKKYRDLQIMIVRESSTVVARAVHFLVIIREHNERWKFDRSNLLKELVDEIKYSADSIIETWRKHEVKVHQMNSVAASAYAEHFELMTQKAITGLVEVQPKSRKGKRDAMFMNSLRGMLSDLNQLKVANQNVYEAFKVQEFNFPEEKLHLLRQIIEKPDFPVRKEEYFFGFRVHLSAVRDILDMKKFDNSSEEDFESKPLEKPWEEGVALLEEQFQILGKKDVLEGDKALWPHQKGVTQVGPYRVLPLLHPETFLTFDSNAAEEGTYHVKEMETMKCFSNCSGKFTKLCKVTKKERVLRASLKIPKEAAFYRYFHPVGVNDEWSDLERRENREQIYRNQSPLHAILMNGGFGYYDNTGAVIQINGLAPGEDFFFDGPYFLPSKRGFEETLMTNVSENLDSLMVAEKHGWVANLTDLNKFKVNVDDPDFFPSKTRDFGGGFVFQYNNTTNPEWDRDSLPEGGRRNYFQLMDFQELKLRKKKHRNNPVLNKLGYEIQLKRKEWDELLPAMPCREAHNKNLKKLNKCVLM